MTGYDIIKRAFSLLGISKETVFCNSEAENSSSLELLNQLLTDLKCKQIASLSEPLEIGERKGEALGYGIAMLMALTFGDSAKNQLFAGLYNAKRALALAEKDVIRDVLPEITEV